MIADLAAVAEVGVLIGGPVDDPAVAPPLEVGAEQPAVPVVLEVLRGVDAADLLEAAVLARLQCGRRDAADSAIAHACPAEWEVVQEYALPLGSDGRVPDLAVVRRRPLPSGTQPYPQGLKDFGLVVEISSPSTRKTDLFAKPGEYAEAGIPLFWRVDLQPELAVHPFRLGPDGYVPVDVLRSSWPVPRGSVEPDLRRLVTGR